MSVLHFENYIQLLASSNWSGRVTVNVPWTSLRLKLDWLGAVNVATPGDTYYRCICRVSNIHLFVTSVSYTIGHGAESTEY